MSVLAPLGFIILILTIGFRYNNWTLALLVFMFSGVFAVLLGLSNVEEVRNNWSQRRCDLDILVTAQMYKPTDDPRSGGEFAAENFTFCTRSIMVSFIEMMLAPVYVMLNQQLNVAESINGMLNSLRTVQANFMKGFTSLLDPFFNRFRTTGSQFGVTYQKMLSAMSRAMGITQAMLYIGMSLILAVENFVHFVINVVVIIMWIILGLMILLFFLILPVFGLIVYTCQTIGNSPFGYMSQEVCGELCFDPETRMRMKDGRVKPLKACEVGDILEDGSVIEGLLFASGEEEPILVLDGIRVSGAHLVWFEEKEEWIAVAHHPSSNLSLQRCKRLICLRTSTRNIPIQGLSKIWTFRDWEELPTNIPSSDTIWDFLVSEILNQKPLGVQVPIEHPLLKGSCKVMHKTGEMRNIYEIQIGDIVYSSQGFTRVTGIYKGQSMFSKGADMTDGVWLQHLGSKEWVHPSEQSNETVEERGFHLTTESGCFWVQTNQFSGFVRDFTEVGAKNLFLTYNYTRSLLKKSITREESCVSDSLLQASLSCLQPIS
jgi:hypothetical protein